jgi:type VI secretion system protein ImpM
VSGSEIGSPGSPGVYDTPRRPGLYGKLPARGDFLSRRLDADFVAAWDEWLQGVMRESREVLGERWLECFLSAPVWRFALPAGMVSDAGWVGLLVPSVDRVGRYFPLTVAAPIQEDGIDVPATLARALPWLDSIEALALDALKPELDFDAFDQRLAQSPLSIEIARKEGSSDDTVPIGTPQAAFEVWQFAPEGADTALQQTLRTGLPGRRASSAVWLTQGGETHAPCLAVCGGPISGQRFCAMLDGRWRDHSWTLPLATNEHYCAAQNSRGRLDSRSGQGAGDGEEVGTRRPLTAPPSSADGADMNSGLEK